MLIEAGAAYGVDLTAQMCRKAGLSFDPRGVAQFAGAGGSSAEVKSGGALPMAEVRVRPVRVGS